MSTQFNSHGASPSPKRALLVDADPSFVRTATEWLTGEGYEVLAATDFNSARSTLERCELDLLISDVRLGAFNGLHLVLISKVEHPLVRALLLNGYDDPVLRAEASHAGAQYLVKPVDRDTLLEAVRPAAFAAVR